MRPLILLVCCSFLAACTVGVDDNESQSEESNEAVSVKIGSGNVSFNNTVIYTPPSSRKDAQKN